MKKIFDLELLNSNSNYSYEDYVEYCHDMEITPCMEGSDAFWSWVYDMRDSDYEDFFYNLRNSDYNNCPCVITGNLGLWNGSHEIKPMRYETLSEALTKCLTGSYYGYKVILNDGKIEIECYHHDGTNCFEISILSSKGIDRVKSYNHFIENDDLKDYWFKNIFGYLF